MLMAPSQSIYLSGTCSCSNVTVQKRTRGRIAPQACFTIAATLLCAAATRPQKARSRRLCTQLFWYAAGLPVIRYQRLEQVDAMQCSKSRISVGLLLALSLPLSAADKSKNNANTEQPSYEQPQPQRETLDMNMYQRIRIEGLEHSHVMEYASALDDDIGPRLTGSENVKHANEWTRDQFTAMGCKNAHLEDWGDFGMGWKQLNTWVRMTSPDTAVFVAQAAPWSPATNGAVSGQAVWMDVKDEKDLDQYRGKLSGKIVFYGAMRDVPPVEKPL